jgi:hypothetical protein
MFASVHPSAAHELRIDQRRDPESQRVPRRQGQMPSTPGSLQPALPAVRVAGVLRGVRIRPAGA